MTRKEHQLRIAMTAAFRRLGFVALAASLTAACAVATPPLAGVPVPDPGATAAAVERATAPSGPRQANFRWELNEAGSRLNGQGVARTAPPDRLRLDLFGPRGETYLAAALIGEEFRVPGEVAQRFALPSPSLLWAALGVVRPPAGATVDAVTAGEGRLALRYALPDGRAIEYRFSGSAASPRLDRVEVRGRGGVHEVLELAWTASDVIETARYRDVAAFRELTLRMDRITDASPFPEAIWTPSAG
jgi:hypothetical protein